MTADTRRTNPFIRDRLLAVTTALFALIAIACAVAGTIMLLGDGA